MRSKPSANGLLMPALMRRRDKCNMTIIEARRIWSDYHFMTNPTEEDTFLYVEALRYLIEETKASDYMVELGGMYYKN